MLQHLGQWASVQGDELERGGFVTCSCGWRSPEMVPRGGGYGRHRVHVREMAVAGSEGAPLPPMSPNANEPRSAETEGS